MRHHDHRGGLGQRDAGGHVFGTAQDDRIGIGETLEAPGAGLRIDDSRVPAKVLREGHERDGVRTGTKDDQRQLGLEHFDEEFDPGASSVLRDAGNATAYGPLQVGEELPCDRALSHASAGLDLPVRIEEDASAKRELVDAFGANHRRKCGSARTLGARVEKVHETIGTFARGLDEDVHHTLASQPEAPHELVVRRRIVPDENGRPVRKTPAARSRTSPSRQPPLTTPVAPPASVMTIRAPGRR